MARPVSCLFLEQGSLLCVMPNSWGSQGMLSSGVGISCSGGFFCSRAAGRHLQSSYSSCSRLLYLLPSCFLTPNRPCTLCWYGAVTQMETALASIKPRGLPWIVPLSGSVVMQCGCEGSSTMQDVRAFRTLQGHVQFPFSYCSVHAIGSKWLVEKWFKIPV